jgi:hypothetical protein
MVMKFTNNATSTLASGITNSATSLTVASGNGALFPTLGGSDYFYCTLANTSGTVEIVKVTARSTRLLLLVVKMELAVLLGTLVIKLNFV